jgi:hypothetical protein
MGEKLILDFDEKGYLFLNSVYELDIIEKFNEEIRNFMNKNNIYIHLTKKQDVQEDLFYVNNSYMSLNSYQKIQYYYLPVIDNRGGHNRITDVGMMDIYNANKLFPSIMEYFNIEIILSILKKITGKNWKLLRTNIQICSNVINPNSFHFDNEYCIKYAIYLSDILNNENGPPVYIEKTHNIKNNIKNNNIKTFLGKKGDVLISYQNGIHRKLPQNNSTVGFLVFNFICS